MHTPAGARDDRTGSVFEGVTFYHWLVVIIASAGWLFDCMDQRLFILGRESALRELMPGDPSGIRTHIGYATTSMILGWATGGIIFGMTIEQKWHPVVRAKRLVDALTVQESVIVDRNRRIFRARDSTVDVDGTV